jgi:hypothetical protein
MASDSEQLRAFRTVLDEALGGSEGTVRDQAPLDALAALTTQSLPELASEPMAVATLRHLDAIAAHGEVDAALQAAGDLFESSERFREAIYFARWLRRDPARALALMRARTYVSDAAVPFMFADLATDAEAVLLHTSFSGLWPQPGKFDSALGSLEQWRQAYVAAYTAAHFAYNRALGLIADGIDEVAAHAAAVERLNNLRRLGPPVAEAALQQFRELERLFACPIAPAGLDLALARQPNCPECGFLLGRTAPSADARRVRQAVEHGLSTQQRRLAQRVVTRLLAQPAAGEEETLSRFIQVVQASDLNGLALALDQEILQFLRRLLEADVAETDVFERLATSFPEVTLANLDSVVAEARRLLAADVVRAGGVLRIARARRDA